MEIPEDYMERLRAVFDLCDIAQQGYISVEHFKALANEHFGAAESGDEDLSRIVSVLDPEGDGKIHFEDFCEGVKQILELKSPGSPAILSGPGPAGLFPASAASEETLVPRDEDNASCGTHETTSELSTYNEYDMMTDDDVTVAGVTGSPPSHLRRMVGDDDRDSAISARSMDITDQHRRQEEVSAEEDKFEDYGEAAADKGEATPDRPHTLQLPASHLFRGSGSSTGHSRRSSCSDDFYDDIDGNFSELNDKVRILETQLSVLTEKQHRSDEKQLRLKEENSFLVERIHILEEQLREIEMKSVQRLEDERRKHREVLSKTDKEKSQEIELLSLSLKHIEMEYKSLKEEAPRLRSENERLRKENAQLESQLRAAQSQLCMLAEEHAATHDRLHFEKSDIDKERKANAELLDELSRELEELRTYKVEQEARGGGAAGRSDVPRSQRRQMETHILALRQENARLREQNSELQASLLSSSVRAGRSLLEGGVSTIAQEIENLPKDELMKALADTREENRKLRDYVDIITLRCLEKNPSILEINGQK